MYKNLSSFQQSREKFRSCYFFSGKILTSCPVRPRAAVTSRGGISKRDANSHLYAVAVVDNGGGEISEDTRVCVFIVHT